MFFQIRSGQRIPTAARGRTITLALAVVVGTLALALWGVPPHGSPALLAADPGADDGYDLGAFTCDFGLSTDLSLADAVPILEDDRRHMSARPGFLHKHVPLSVDLMTG